MNILFCVKKCLYLKKNTFLDPFLLVAGGDLLAVCLVFGEGFFSVGLTTCSGLFVGYF